jgi:hypothetical protein
VLLQASALGTANNCSATDVGRPLEPPHGERLAACTGDPVHPAPPAFRLNPPAAHQAIPFEPVQRRVHAALGEQEDLPGPAAQASRDRVAVRPCSTSCLATSVSWYYEASLKLKYRYCETFEGSEKKWLFFGCW